MCQVCALIHDKKVLEQHSFCIWLEECLFFFFCLFFYVSAHSFVKAAGTFRADGRTKNDCTGLLPVADLHRKVA